ncbi:MAG: hypothetical protein CMM25_08945 [Rhodospirillaceae bacterium]|nr:hypothetical protein [Rhodospirillaceae bacterium]
MTVFQQVSDTVIIDDEKFPLDLFMRVEPDYEVVDYRNYEEGKTHIIINKGQQNGGPINWKDGNRYAKRSSDLKYLDAQIHIDEEERKTKVETSKNANLPYDVKRNKEYPPIEDLVIAMWEYLCLKSPKELERLETKRQEIKKKFPKHD